MTYKHKMSAFDKRVDNFFKNYHDRGMIKWGGFFLSDHRVALNKSDQQRQTVYKKKPEMEMDAISKTMLKAYSDHYQVDIQMKTLDAEGNFSADIKGFIEGYLDSGTIVISGNLIDLDDVNNIQIIE